MDKAPKFKLLTLKNQDPFLNRLESVEAVLTNYLAEEDDREIEKCLTNVQQAIFWYQLAFPDIEQPDEDEEGDLEKIPTPYCKGNTGIP